MYNNNNNMSFNNYFLNIGTDLAAQLLNCNVFKFYLPKVSIGTCFLYEKMNTIEVVREICNFQTKKVSCYDVIGVCSTKEKVFAFAPI